MRFIIGRTSEGCCGAFSCGSEHQPTPRAVPSGRKDYDELDEWMIEIDTLDEIVELSSNYDELILRREQVYALPSIEIVDEYGY